MSIQKDQVNSSTQKMCVECNAFFGSEANKGCCSSCYKKLNKECQNDRKASIETCAEANLTNQDIQIQQKQPQKKKEEEAPQNFQKDKKRCYSCRKKVGLLGIECRCGFVYCNSHRLPQEHECQFNHKQQAKKKLESELIKCQHSKIDQI